jgi:uncharacterized protein YdhG (YjbR/CyaY superfamily)
MTPVQEYINNAPAEHRERLAALRGMILQALPGLQEKISYGLATFYLKKNVIHFGLFKAHIGLYPGAAAILHFAGRLKGYHTSKGTVQFPLTEPLPEALIRDITLWCGEHSVR